MKVLTPIKVIRAYRMGNRPTADTDIDSNKNSEKSGS